MTEAELAALEKQAETLELRIRRIVQDSAAGPVKFNERMKVFTYREQLHGIYTKLLNPNRLVLTQAQVEKFHLGPNTDRKVIIDELNARKYQWSIDIDKKEIRFWRQQGNQQLPARALDVAVVDEVNGERTVSPTELKKTSVIPGSVKGGVNQGPIEGEFKMREGSRKALGGQLEVEDWVKDVATRAKVESIGIKGNNIVDGAEHRVQVKPENLQKSHVSAYEAPSKKLFSDVRQSLKPPTTPRTGGSGAAGGTGTDGNKSATSGTATGKPKDDPDDKPPPKKPPPTTPPPTTPPATTSKPGSTSPPATSTSTASSPKFLKGPPPTGSTATGSNATGSTATGSTASGNSGKGGTGTGSPATGGTATQGQATTPTTRVPTTSSRTPASTPSASFNYQPKGNRLSVSIKGAWKPSGRILKGGMRGKGLLDQLLVIQSSVAEVEQAKYGGVDPAVRATIKYAEELFPSADQLMAKAVGTEFTDAKFRSARAWLEQNGQTALKESGQQLETMADMLEAHWRYEASLSMLEVHLEFARRDVEPWYEEIEGWSAGLNHIAHVALKEAENYVGVPGAPETFLTIYKAYFEAGKSVGMVEDFLKGRIVTYEARRRDARNTRREIALSFNKWGTQWAKAWTLRTGKTPAGSSIAVPAPLVQ